MSESGNSDESLREFKQLNFSGIQFPSDRLTIQTLRQLHPDLFDQGFDDGREAQPLYFLRPNRKGHAVDGVGDLLFCERLIAVSAYVAVKGLDGPRGWDLEEYKKHLSDAYCRYRLAGGTHQSKELIRDIERQATRLANLKGR